MRSRNGDHPLLHFGCALVLGTTLGADEYLIGYRLITQNATVAQERLHVTPAMQPCQGLLQPPLTLSASDTLSTTLQRHRDAFDAYLRQHFLHVQHLERSVNHTTSSLTTLTFPTACFEVEFKAGFATIALIK